MAQAAFIAKPQPCLISQPLGGADLVAMADAAQLASWREWAQAGPIELPLALEAARPTLPAQASSRPSLFVRLLNSLERVGLHLRPDHMV